MLTLVIGGARSGKSRFAMSLCPAQAKVTFIATALASDDEMQSRIARHRRERPAQWKTIEEPLELAAAVALCVPESDFVIVDCLTLWLSNICWRERESTFVDLERIASGQIKSVAQAAIQSQVILVTNEVGCSLVPDSVLGRTFQDLQGFVNQWAARSADAVYLTVAGIPITIKPRQSTGSHS
jgi:adenosylcobinamide kinase/adenosylcobinamide-phosphate guanylyltransferase